MPLIDQISADLDAVFYNTDEFAETITLNGVTVSALVGDIDNTTEQSLNVHGAELSCCVRVSEVASVVNGQSAIVRGVNYRVIGDPVQDRLEWSFMLGKNLVSL